MQAKIRKDFMALPIRETPVLTGKDAVRFIKQMHYVETHAPTKKDIRAYKRAKKVYEECKAKGMEDIDLP